MTNNKLLRELHRLRSFLRDLRTELERIPKTLKVHQNKVIEKEKALQDLQNQIKKFKVEQHEKETEIKGFADKLKRYEAQLEASKSSKEIEANQHQIQYCQQQIKELEETILQRMATLDEQQLLLPTAENQLKKAKGDLEQFQIDSQNRKQRNESEIVNCEAQLRELELQIPSTIKANIDRLVKSYGPDGFAKVENRTCQNCQSEITKQQLSEIERDHFLCCSRCGRALYLAEG